MPLNLAHTENRIRISRNHVSVFPAVLGTLASYALFPYLPSSPPRVVFPEQDLPQTITFLRRFNLFVVRGYGIHSSLFPSAHVSSAYSAVWAFWMFLPDKKRLAWGMTVYATLVAVATVYGRYQYAWVPWRDWGLAWQRRSW